MMGIGKLQVAALAGAGILLAAQVAWADPPLVKVELSDQGGKMIIKLSTDKVKAGPVDFMIKNTSTDMMHEFLITRWEGPITSLPYDAKENEVIEDKLHDLTGSEDMKPGAEATILVQMKPGKYVVFCNQTGHYKLGMERRFTVVR